MGIHTGMLEGLRQGFYKDFLWYFYNSVRILNGFYKEFSKDSTGILWGFHSGFYRDSTRSLQDNPWGFLRSSMGFSRNSHRDSIMNPIWASRRILERVLKGF